MSVIDTLKSSKKELENELKGLQQQEKGTASMLSDIRADIADTTGELGRVNTAIGVLSHKGN